MDTNEYKQLFSLPHMIEDLLWRQMGDWTRALDLETLARLPDGYVREHSHRDSGPIWRVRFRASAPRHAGKWLYLPLEFTARMRRDMAVHAMDRTRRLHEELYRRAEAHPDDPPPTLPLVICNGGASAPAPFNWNA